MIGIDLLPVETLGILSSVIAGLLTLIPALGLTTARRAGVAIVTLILAVLAKDGFAFETWQVFLQTLGQATVYAVVTYQIVLKPLVLPTARKVAGLTSK
jgi:hypothetical protein